MTRVLSLIAILGVSLSSLVSQRAGAQEQPQEKTVQFKVSLHCQACKARVERDIAFEKGVKRIDANLESKVVSVTYRTNRNDDESLRKAIEKLGYKAEIIDPQAQKGE